MQIAYAWSVQLPVNVPVLSISTETDHVVLLVGWLSYRAVSPSGLPPVTKPPPTTRLVPTEQVAVAVFGVVVFDALTVPGTIS